MGVARRHHSKRVQSPPLKNSHSKSCQFLSSMSPLHLLPLVMMAVAIPQRNSPRQREFDGHEFVELLPEDFTRDEYETLLQEFQTFLLRQELISRGDFVDVDNLECTPKIGKYTVEDPAQCDKYYVCETDGTLVPKLCEDGLVYDIPGKSCNHPQRVECKARTELQEPIPSPGCPRKNGYFHPEEPEKCNEYTTCVDGNPTPGKCSTGVVWSPRQTSASHRLRQVLRLLREQDVQQGVLRQ